MLHSFLSFPFLLYSFNTPPSLPFYLSLPALYLCRPHQSPWETYCSPTAVNTKPKTFPPIWPSLRVHLINSTPPNSFFTHPYSPQPSQLDTAVPLSGDINPTHDHNQLARPPYPVFSTPQTITTCTVALLVFCSHHLTLSCRAPPTRVAPNPIPIVVLFQFPRRIAYSFLTNIQTCHHVTGSCPR